MKNILFVVYSLLFSVAPLLLAGCTDDLVTVPDGCPSGGDHVGQPVLFSAGNVGAAITRASVPYMAQGGRFVCTMYYHSAIGDTDESDFDIKDVGEGEGQHGTMTTAWLRVNNNVGNSVYRKGTFDETGMTTDDFGFDKDATMFYWQNRLTHAFLALADYNKLTTNNGATTDQGKLKMYPNGDENSELNTYDLMRGSRESMAEQPDPIQALTIMKPSGATQEANRVRLYFKHQFSQIQVNIKGADDNSANITADQIEGVELLGVSTEGYVCNRLNANGTVGASSAKEVDLDAFSDAELEDNKWGTSFQMFDMAPLPLVDADGDGHDDRYAIGYLKSYNAIAFGNLWAIRITWHEGTTADPGIKHVSTFEVPQNNEEKVNLRELASGMKYIYNLELRRGTLAIIRTEILPWGQDEDLVYGTDGTIFN